MRRAVCIAVLFLLLGASINVAVAWWFAVRGCIGFPGAQMREVSSPSAWPGQAGHGWPERPESLDRIDVTGFTLLWADAHGPEPADNRTNATLFKLAVFRTGFPLRSMTWEARGTLEDPRGAIYAVFGDEIGTWREGIEPPPRWLSQEEFVESHALRRLPVRPLWPAFGLNTLLYGAACWTLLGGPFTLRRWRRVRRGLCVGCGYPVEGLARCPECGEGSAGGATGTPISPG